MTVTGYVDQSDLGVVLPHEHILLDLSVWWQAPNSLERAYLVDLPVDEIDRVVLARDPYHAKSNMVLDDLDLAVQELSAFKLLGGSTVVDLSTRTIGPYPESLRKISELTGLNIVAGTGFYVRRAHPEWLAEASVGTLAGQMIYELTEGFAGTDIRAGIIGELGTGSPIHADEIKVLQAAAEAHRETGAAINIHLSIFAREGHQVLDILTGCGVPENKIALSHLDELLDFSYHKSLAERGCFIEFDCFGSECEFAEDGLAEPKDSDRLAALERLLEAGFEKQLLLSQDVCTKMQLLKYGGKGYVHVLKQIVPELQHRGISQPTLEQMLINNPARFVSCS